ncbi:MAG: MOFRL family protein, partial [Planctomycetaceae bacterium]
RKQLSAIKGGGLARAIRAGHTETLIISDVVGDPLDIIASGPTVPDTGSPAAALAVLDRLGVAPPAIPAHVIAWLRQKAADQPTPPAPTTTLHTTIIGRNQTALAASAAAAVAAGCELLDLGSNNTGEATEVGQALARLARAQQAARPPHSPPLCLLSGGEPIVRLPSAHDRGLGGRNQQLALAALIEWYFAEGSSPESDSTTPAPVLLSGGTDGEDGPTDAAGAIASHAIARRARDLGLDPHSFLRRCDAWHFFDRCGGLLKTGPTHTNVMDLRVIIV